MILFYGVNQRCLKCRWTLLPLPTFTRQQKNSLTLGFTLSPQDSLALHPSSTPAVQVPPRLPFEGRRQDVRGCGRVHLHIPVHTALRQHARQLPLPLHGWLPAEPRGSHSVQVHLRSDKRRTSETPWPHAPSSPYDPIILLLSSLTDVEPFLIFANRYYLRKLNLNGSNYTLLIQVRLQGSRGQCETCGGKVTNSTVWNLTIRLEYDGKEVHVNPILTHVQSLIGILAVGDRLLNIHIVGINSNIQQNIKVAT